MKSFRIVLICCVIICITSLNSEAQLGGVLNKVKNKIVDKALGKEDTNGSVQAQKVGQEPICACIDAIPVLKFTENIKIAYKEATFCLLDDGSLLVYDKMSQKYYTAKDGKVEGPFEKGDPKVKQCSENDNSSENSFKIEDLIAQNKGMIIPEGEKYSILFNGKKYGPYAIIQNFVRNQSNTKFAAIVTQDVIMTEKQGAKMEQELNNAKTQQEQMEIAMKMSQQIQKNMMSSGRDMDISPKIVSNIPGAKYDMAWGGATLSNKVKYDEIVYIYQDKILDLSGKTIYTFDKQKLANSSNNYWLSSDNSRLASFDYGAVTFSDGKQCTEIFGLKLMKQDGIVYLVYMYYSPKNDAIMQCKIPF